MAGQVSRREHWDGVYAGKPATEVSWYQERPQRALALMREAGVGASASVIDVGGGSSRLVDVLLADGFADLTVLDVSAVALRRARERLGARADAVTWIVADITAWQPDRTRGVWHDRAVFHFLTDSADQDAYVTALHRGTHPGSIVVLSCFAPDGPERCSGLPVQRYSSAALAQRIGPDFRLEQEAAEQHCTPAGRTQSFAYAVLRRR
jgi:SAM-dependent methyltransferase